MLEIKEIRNNEGEIEYIETSLTGADLLSTPKLNKGTAFSYEERQRFKLEGLLPSQIETLEQQTARMYAQYHEHHTNLGKNIYLNVLHDYNETLFYKLISDHLEEMLPIIYTPTVGEAVERFSLELRKPRGLYISYDKKDRMEEMLENGLPRDTELIVVTDGEAVLGIGDQGIGGIKICNAKLMVYTLCANINPHRMQPIQLDVGTNNQQLLSDPMYLGCRHERVTGQAYDDFIDVFVTQLNKKFPHVYLHWEDFGRDNSRRILTRYRDSMCTINGDMQSTGAITLACLLAACQASKLNFNDQRIVIFGAGTAGVGIADQIFSAMIKGGLSEHEARARFWLLDKQGLLVANQDMLPFQRPYARSPEEVTQWKSRENYFSLYDVINYCRPTTLIGASAVGSAFTEEIIKLMSSFNKQPIIMPLSNPTYKSEATPEDILRWSQGQAIIATGSPFPDVIFAEHKIRISQSNNAFAFPGIGLGAIAAKATRLTDDMIWAATQTLSQHSPMLRDSSAPLLPKLSETKHISFDIALAVARTAREQGLAAIPDQVDLEKALKQVMWEPRYYLFKGG